MTPGKMGRLGALPRKLGKDTKALRGDRQTAGGTSWNRSSRNFFFFKKVAISHAQRKKGNEKAAAWERDLGTILAILILSVRDTWTKRWQL